jgi:dihydrofolate reductase
MPSRPTCGTSWRRAEEIARLINTTAMTVDGVIDVGDWFVAVGDHDDAARSLFETNDAAMLVGRKSFEGFAGYWPSAAGPWADGFRSGSTTRKMYESI